MRIDKNASFICFVYPFLFDPETFEQREKAIGSAQWQGRDGKAIWRKLSFPKDDLLAHVERYLNPPQGTPPTAYLWQMEHDPLHSPHGFGADAQWTLVLPTKEIPFSWDRVQLSLFVVGVGFVTVTAKPQSDKVDDWLDFLHYFRFIRGQRNVKVKGERRTGPKQTEPFFPEPAGGIQKHPDGKGNFAEILDAMLQTGSKAHLDKLSTGENEIERWWREVFVPGQLIPFAVLYIDEENISDEDVAKLLYRVRNFFPAQRVIQPAPDDLQLDHPSLLPYADKMWFVFSLEGGAFVAVNAPQTDFFRRELPNHLRDQYFLLFLLSLHQRFTLMSLSQEVSEHWLRGSETERIKAFERIRNTLLDFTARGYFTQVMQREHHHRVYRKWQEIFQLEQLYREVSDEVREMHEYLVSEQTKRLERRLNLFGAFIGVPALVMGFLSINLYGITAAEEGLPLKVAILIAAASLVLGGLFWWLLSRHS